VSKEKEEKPLEEATTKPRKWGFKKNKADEPDSMSSISISSSKAIVFTGHRGGGSTCTAANVAITASRQGVKTIFVDFDIDYRSSNLYFGEFYTQADEDEYIESSLMRMLAQPQSYETTAVNVGNNLWVTALGYGFNDNRLMEQHFTETKTAGLITALKHNFDLVVIDLPLDKLAILPGLLNNFDMAALCMENTIYAALTTLRNISIALDERERIAYLASKSKLIVTKYNDESMYNDEVITPERFSGLIATEGFCEDFTVEMPVAGSVPYIKWFGKQIETDIPVMDMDSGMQKAYEEILLRLLGAAR
jgi:septum formation inhibitor-activating ATPase MinD